MRAYLLAMCFAMGVSASVEVDANGCVIGYSSGTDYFPSDTQLSIEINYGQFVTPLPGTGATTSIVFANLFRVDYFNTFKVVSLNYTLQASGYSGQSVPPLVLWRCGTPEPVPGTTSGVPANARLFRVPLATVAVPGTVPLTFLHILGLLDKISLIDGTYVSSPCIQKLETCSSPQLVQHELSWNTSAWNSSAMQADGVFTDMWLGGGTLTDKDIPFDSSADLGPLHRAEWLKFVALFFNMEGQANTLFNSIRSDYDRLKVHAQGLANTGAPVVAWVSYSTWTNYTISGAQYKQQYISDAGGVPRVIPAANVAGCRASGISYQCDTPAALKAALTGVQMIIDESYEFDPAAFGTDQFIQKYGITAADQTNSDLPFLVNNKVYRQDLTHADARSSGDKGLAWFETAVPFPNRVLSDMMRALYGEAETACTRQYLRHISLSGHQGTEEAKDTACMETCATVQLHKAVPSTCKVPPSESPSQSPATPSPTVPPPTSKPSESPSLTPTRPGQTSFPSQSPATSSPTQTPTSPPTARPVTAAEVQTTMNSLVNTNVAGLTVQAASAGTKTNGNVNVMCTLSGTVASFDITTQNNVLAFFAAQYGISVSRFTNVQVTAASVALTFDIVNDPTSAPTSAPTTPPIKNNSDDDVAAWVIAVPVVLGVLVVVAVVLVFVFCGKKGDAQPPGEAAAQQEENKEPAKQPVNAPYGDEGREH